MNKRYIILFTIGLICSFQLRAQATININKYLRSNFGIDTMWNEDTVRIFGIADHLADDPHIPATVIYCNEGDSVIINALSISQFDHHTIHLHGLDVDTRNDGDPATSFYLEHMQDTTYSFKATNAGIYLYHCHMADAIHVQMGMYGLLVVKAAGGAKTAYTGGPPFSKSYNWIFSEIDTFWHRHIPVHDDIADTSRLPGPYNPSYFLINGHSETQLATDDSTQITGRENEYIYIRIGAIGFFRNRVIFPSWLNAKIIDSDGRPLPDEIETDTLDISPGERYGVMLYPSDQLEDFIPVQYVNMNTYEVWNTQYIPVNISGIVSIDDAATSGITLFPNPVTDIITLSGLGKHQTQILIKNQIGQIIKTYSNNTETFQINSKDLPAGYYEVIITKDDQSHSIPFVKQ